MKNPSVAHSGFIAPSAKLLLDQRSNLRQVVIGSPQHIEKVLGAFLGKRFFLPQLLCNVGAYASLVQVADEIMQNAMNFYIISCYWKSKQPKMQALGLAEK